MLYLTPLRRRLSEEAEPPRTLVRETRHSSPSRLEGNGNKPLSLQRLGGSPAHNSEDHTSLHLRLCARTQLRSVPIRAPVTSHHGVARYHPARRLADALRVPRAGRAARTPAISPRPRSSGR